MASLKRRLETNVPGDFFVDASCIDCDTCRWLAPLTFDKSDGRSRVYCQPSHQMEQHQALMALLACPTSSIGISQSHDLTAAKAAFPNLIDGQVYHCGYHAASSFGAASYLIRRPQGNVLIDSPRFTTPLVRRLEELGGVRLMVLSHCDDVADHRRFRAHFGCERVMHRDDVEVGTADVDIQIAGRDVVALDEELLFIPVPGHTRGSACLLYHETYLFSGDHLAWDPERNGLQAFREACWYSWMELTASMIRLAEQRFTWVLPGHGRRCHLPEDRMAAEMQRCLSWMRQTA
jgi:glyoxylase-like metal-dependent hydrolase (beta-lactamase superfamily II)/ferredoxin